MPLSTGRSRSRKPEHAVLSHILIVLAVVGFLFRRPIGRLLARQFPDRAKRHQVVGIVITAFVLVILVRLLALLWK